MLPHRVFCLLAAKVAVMRYEKQEQEEKTRTWIRGFGYFGGTRF
jgi:hypothetical protein